MTGKFHLKVAKKWRMENGKKKKRAGLQALRTGFGHPRGNGRDDTQRLYYCIKVHQYLQQSMATEPERLQERSRCKIRCNVYEKWVWNTFTCERVRKLLPSKCSCSVWERKRVAHRRKSSPSLTPCFWNPDVGGFCPWLWPAGHFVKVDQAQFSGEDKGILMTIWSLTVMSFLTSVIS